MNEEVPQHRLRILSENLFELLDLAILCVNDSHEIIYANRGVEPVFGYPPAELLGRSLDLLIPESYHSIHENHVQVFQASSGSQRRMGPSQEILGVRKDGQEFPADATIAKHETGDGLILTAIVRDVSAERMLEQSLRANLEKLQVLVEQASEGIMVLDQGGYLIEVNTSACAMLGCTPDEMIGHPFRDFVNPKDLEQFPLRIEEVRSGATIVVERLLQRKDGSLQSVEISARMLSDGRILALVRDFTERKRIENELRKLSSVVEQTPALVIITDTSGKIEYVNPAFTRISGYSFEDAVGDNPRILKSGLTPDETFREMWSTIAAGEVWRGELCNRKKDGTIFWDLGTVSPIRGPSGEITHYIAVKEDISARKQVEQELERYRVSLEELVDERTTALREEIAERRHAQSIARLGNWEWSVEEQVLYWSQETYEIYDLPPMGAQLTYETFLNALHPEERELVESAFNRALSSGQPLSLDHRILLPDGSERVVHDEALVVHDQDGRPIKMTGTVQDITERRQMEQQLLEKERLEEDLRVGRDIQQTILPKSVPVVPGWQFATAYQPARQVGGDFYDFIPLPVDRIGMVIADVVGKGVPAALFMALSRAIIRTTAVREITPVQTLLHSNRVIVEDYNGELFFTAWYALLDPANGSLQFANGGHNRPLWHRASRGRIEELHAEGIVLGVLPEIDLAQGDLTIEQGDVLLFYSDGLTEAENEERAQFGHQRLKDIFAANVEKDAEDQKAVLLDAVRSFIGKAPQHDDITFFVVKHELE